MASRMDRYKDIDNTVYSRTQKNQDLYKQIFDYNTAEYSNIESVTPISKSNEIDLQKLKDMLQKSENESVRTRYKAVNASKTTLEDLETNDDNYDINSIISKVKSNHKEDNSHRSLKKVDLDFLKSLDLSSSKEKEVDVEPTSIDVVKQMDDNELCLDMLSELKSSDETMSRTRTNMDLHKLIEEDIEESKNKKIDSEQTFFTTKQSFKLEDFESLDDINQEKQPKSNKFNKIIITISVIIIIIIFVYFIIKLWI